MTDGDADGSASSDGDGRRPLDGVTVVEAGTMISGPMVGTFFAEFGADVVKVEHPDGGDHLRRFGPQVEGTSVWWKHLGRNKRSVTLDLKSEAGKTVFRDLVGEADLVVENFRPGTLERWGLGYDALAERTPGLVLLRLSGFGQTGPYAERPGFGTLAEAMSGFAAVNGFPDREPLLPPTGLADAVAALYGTIGALMALYHRDVGDGEGQVVDTSLIEPMLGVLGPQVLRYDQTGTADERAGNRSTSSAPRNVYRTADDEYVAIAASAQPLAMRVFDAIDRYDLKDDPRFVDNESRLEHVEELDAIVQEWMLEHDRPEVLKRFDEADATIAPVFDVDDIVNDEHYRARNAIATVDDSDLGTARVQNVFPLLSKTPGRIDHLGPDLGEHNDEVYRGLLGYDDAMLAELREEGAI